MPGITLQGTGAWEPQKSRMMHTLDTLVRDLRALGLVPGDVVFVHSSFKSLGDVSKPVYQTGFFVVRVG